MISATSAPAQGQGVLRKDRARGLASSQTSAPSPTKKPEYLASSPSPPFTPTPSHQRPSLVASTFARKNRNPAVALTDSVSGVAASISTPIIKVRLNNKAASAARPSSFR